MKRSDVLAVYRKDNKRVTKAKLEILDFFENEKNLVDVSTVADSLRGIADITTVYRNLEYLESIGYLELVMKDDKRWYKRAEDYEKHKHYITCRVCGKKELLNFCPIAAIEDEHIDNFEVKEHIFELIGVCDKCKDSIDEKKDKK